MKVEWPCSSPFPTWAETLNASCWDLWGRGTLCALAGAWAAFVFPIKCLKQWIIAVGNCGCVQHKYRRHVSVCVCVLLFMLFSPLISCTLKPSYRFLHPNERMSCRLSAARRGGARTCRRWSDRNSDGLLIKGGRGKKGGGVKLRYREQEKAKLAVWVRAPCRARGWSPAAPLICSPSPPAASAALRRPCSRWENGL